MCAAYFVEQSRITVRNKDYNTANYTVIPYARVISAREQDYHCASISKLKVQLAEINREYEALQHLFWRFLSQTDRTHYDPTISFRGLHQQQILSLIQTVRQMNGRETHVRPEISPFTLQETRPPTACLTPFRNITLKADTSRTRIDTSRVQEDSHSHSHSHFSEDGIKEDSIEIDDDHSINEEIHAALICALEEQNVLREMLENFNRQNQLKLAQLKAQYEQKLAQKQEIIDSITAGKLRVLSNCDQNDGRILQRSSKSKKKKAIA